MINPFTEDDTVWSWDPPPEPKYCGAGHRQPDVPLADVPEHVCLHCLRELEAAKGYVTVFDGPAVEGPEIGRG